MVTRLFAIKTNQPRVLETRGDSLYENLLFLRVGCSYISLLSVLFPHKKHVGWIKHIPYLGGDRRSLCWNLQRRSKGESNFTRAARRAGHKQERVRFLHKYKISRLVKFQRKCETHLNFAAPLPGPKNGIFSSWAERILYEHVRHLDYFASLYKKWAPVVDVFLILIRIMDRQGQLLFKKPVSELIEVS